MDLKEAREFDNQMGASRHPWELARSEVVYSLMCKHFNFLQRENPTILDIGCGDTFLLGSLSQRLPRSKLIGVDTELNQRAIARYSKPYSNMALYNSFGNLEIKNDSVDIVLLLDVLEHIEDDKGVLENIVQNRAISNNALFFITVPAFQFLFSSHDQWLGHYRRYNLGSLSCTLEGSNLKIIDQGYFFLSLLFIRIITVFFEKLNSRFGDNKGIGAWEAPSFFTRLVKTVLYFDYLTVSFINKFGFKLPGLSCYMICQKQEL